MWSPLRKLFTPPDVPSWLQARSQPESAEGSRLVDNSAVSSQQWVPQMLMSPPPRFGRINARNKVSRFWTAKYIFRGKDFCFYHMFKTNNSEHNKIWRAQKRFRVTVPKCPTVSAGLSRTIARKCSIGGLHVFVGGLDILKVYF